MFLAVKGRGERVTEETEQIRWSRGWPTLARRIAFCSAAVRVGGAR